MRPFTFLKNLNKKSNSTRRAKARLSVESLEERAVPTVQLIGSALFITGTVGNDDLQLSTTGQGGVLVDFNGQVSTFAPNQINKIEIDPEQGNNLVNIQATPAGVEVTVDCLVGPDTIDVGDGNLSILGGNVTVNGDSGAHVFVNDSVDNTPGDYTMSNGSFNWGASYGISFDSCAAFQVNGTPNSLYTINGTGGTAATQINPSLGTNQILVGGGDLNNIFTPLSVVANGGVSNVFLEDAQHSGSAVYTITNNAVSRSGFAGLTYSGLSNLTLNGNNTGASFVVNSTAVVTSTTIATGTGPNDVTLGGSQLSQLAGPVTVNGHASDHLVLDDHANTLAANYFLGSNTVLPNGSFAGLTYAGVGSLQLFGSAGGDSYHVTATPTAAVTLDGGTDGASLTGPAATTLWTISGQNHGTLGSNVTFFNVASLIGGSGNDTFKFLDNTIFGTAGITTIQGGAGVNTLDYSSLSSSVFVNLTNDSATRIRSGFADGFSGIQRFLGSTSSSNFLDGPNDYTVWSILRANGGFVGGDAFFAFQNLLGGSGVDWFRFFTGGSISGRIDGGTAPAHTGNWLDYSNLSTAVAVNLQTGAATGVVGGLANIQNVHAGNGGSTLIGDSQGNILIGGTGNDLIKGGTGRSILIGDAGSDTVGGGSGNDILIGDKTVFDGMTVVDQEALMSILAEWQSADSYAVRFHDIDTGTGGGLNRTNKLNFGTTVLSDSAADSVTGSASASALDWYFAGQGDTLHNVHTGEHINNT
jgi:hypothetical protein